MTGRPAFVDGLRRHGDGLAVVTATTELTYRELATRVEAVARFIGTGRRLVLIEATNDVDSLVGYLGALHGGHVVLLVAGSDPAQTRELTQRFDPDVVIGADDASSGDSADSNENAVRSRRTGTRHRLHPDLTLLLATSGSTGVPRLVRLSAAALDANATAIATYLRISPADRASLTLPMHYCYGLSVINSNLLGGAAVLLSDASVLDPAFWDVVRKHRATSLHGVPYTFELLDRVGFADVSLTHLRYITQAGGRLAPDAVRRWARVGQRRGWELVVMYGQTEATARMAYLPPELAATHPESVGIAIPGGSFTVEPLDAAPDGQDIGHDVGELVYRGPNVMLGYADDAADLALGRTVHALRTGDLGRVRPDGLIEIVGRRSRFVKPFGIRVDLDGLERVLAEHGIEAATAGTDTELVIAATTPSTDRVRTIVADRTALPARVVRVVALAELPRRANGKPDHPAVARLADLDAAAGERAAGRSWAAAAMRHRRRRPTTVAEGFARAFPGRDLPGDASFVELGGDSLTYVQVAADIERVLGRLPTGWDHLSLSTLEGLAGATATTTGRRATIETGVLLRAVAIVLVVGEHAGLWAVVGGAHLLFALSGWMFARFVMTGRPLVASPDTRVAPSTALSRRILRSAARIAVPSAVWIAFRALLHNVRLIDILLVGSLVPPLVAGYWFVDALVQILIMLALLFTLPVVGRFERLHPFNFAAALLAVALLGRLWPTAYAWWFGVDIYSTQVVLWLFVLGWMAHRAHTTTQRCTTVTAILVLVPTFFGADILRTGIVVAGLLFLLFVPTLVLPRMVATIATSVASASFGIYLTHFGVLPLHSLGAPPAMVVLASILTGLATTHVLGAAMRLLARRHGRVPARTGPSTTPPPRLLTGVPTRS